MKETASLKEIHRAQTLDEVYLTVRYSGPATAGIMAQRPAEREEEIPNISLSHSPALVDTSHWENPTRAACRDDVGRYNSGSSQDLEGQRVDLGVGQMEKS